MSIKLHKVIAWADTAGCTAALYATANRDSPLR
jgi:hypothetical protein